MINFFFFKSLHLFFRPSRTHAFKGNVFVLFWLGECWEIRCLLMVWEVSEFLLDQSKQVLDSFNGKENHSLLCIWRRKICLFSVWRSRITRCLITTVQIENYCSCRFIFCRGFHKNRFTVTIFRRQLATSNENRHRNIDQKGLPVLGNL